MHPKLEVPAWSNISYAICADLSEKIFNLGWKSKLYTIIVTRRSRPSRATRNIYSIFSRKQFSKDIFHDANDA